MGMMGYWMLAQSMEQAEKSLGLLERIQAGGVPLIALLVAVVCGVFAYWQLHQNQEIQRAQLKDAKERETAQIEAAAARETMHASITKARMAEQEGLLREMLDRDREAQEVQLATAKALEGFTESHRDNRRLAEEILRRLEVVERQTRHT